MMIVITATMSVVVSSNIEINILSIILNYVWASLDLAVVILDVGVLGGQGR